jgi:predicted nucleic acid-binding protein
VRGRLLDTNHLGLAVRRNSPVFARIEEELRRGIRIGTCVPVLCEIQVGAFNVANPDNYRRGVKEVMRMVRLWPLTTVTAQLYGEIANELHRRGRALSQVDMILAALCREMDLTLVTTDKDFAALSWLKTENWL